MQRQTFSRHYWRGHLAAAVSGGVFYLSLAPYNLWPLGGLSALSLGLLLINISPRIALWRAFIYGCGLFGGGVSWVYVSIHDFGFTGTPLAVIMTALFVSFLAFIFALPFYAYQRWLPENALKLGLAFPAVWIFGEWLRSWLLTGFPWLYLGYGHIHSPFAGWAPIFGVWGVGFIVLVTTMCSYLGIRALSQRRYVNAAAALTFAAMLLVSGVPLAKIHWTHAQQAPLTVAMAQPNIPLYKKWDYHYFPEITRTVSDQIQANLDQDIVILPENSIPYFYHQAQPLLEQYQQMAQNSGSNLIAGILYDQSEVEFYNSIIGLGLSTHIYHKQRLVPFGEYVPLEKYLRGIIEFFNLPNSIIQVGPLNPAGIQATDRSGHTFKIAPYICYEIVYPELVRQHGYDAQLFITISNDAWFGHSIGPLQHYQMAQMRALENQKYVIRATNTGLSGIIEPDGTSQITGEQFVAQVTHGTVQQMTGLTPYAKWGSYPLYLMLILGIFAPQARKRLADRQTQPFSDTQP